MSLADDGNIREGLCFCEYLSANGKRSHLLATCCDCEALDTACDRCITCRDLPNETAHQLYSVIEDRCRFPWPGGALRLRLEILLPATLTPCSVLIATLGPSWTVFSMAGLLCCLLICFRLWMWRPERRRTVAFFVFFMTSFFQLYLTYLTVVIGFREVFLWETMLLFTLFALTLFFLMRTRNKLALSESQNQDKYQLSYKTESADQSIPEYDVTWIDSRPIIDGRLVTWCSICKAHQPPRSSHCLICNLCVRGRDHHCIWIDVCVGQKNHLDFIITLVLLIFTGLYGAHLTMTTVCTPEMYLSWFLWPSDCRFIYADFPTALSFVSACYVYFGVSFVLIVLLQQIVLITQNVTLVEVRRAAVRGWMATRCVPLIVSRRKNVNDRGALQNWYDFISGCRRQRYLVLSSSAV